MGITAGALLIAAPVFANLFANNHPWAAGAGAIFMSLAIAAGIFAVGLATDERPGWAAYGVMIGPLLLLVYYGTVMLTPPTYLYPAAVVGLILIGLSLRPGKPAAA